MTAAPKVRPVLPAPKIVVIGNVEIRPGTKPGRRAAFFAWLNKAR
jgi:hypothetical protein